MSSPIHAAKMKLNTGMPASKPIRPMSPRTAMVKNQLTAMKKHQNTVHALYDKKANKPAVNTIRSQRQVARPHALGSGGPVVSSAVQLKKGATFSYAGLKTAGN
jgi:hypothetical protein